MKSKCALMWFRRDLRLADNPALHAALKCADSVLPVFIWSPEEESPWTPGAASRWWLHQSLKSLDASLRKRGAYLVVRKGATAKTLLALVESVAADSIHANRCHEPAALARDNALSQELARRGVRLELYDGNLLLDPSVTTNKQGRPFQVFTPFYKALFPSLDPGEPTAVPRKIPAPENPPKSEPLKALTLEPATDWAAGIRAAWKPGEEGARKALEAFLDESLGQYPEMRDVPGTSGTSRLSPHLHFGEISPRSVWHEVRAHSSLIQRAGLVRGEEAFLRQLAWREFAHHLLFHFPETTERPLRPEFEAFPWRDDSESLRVWQRGNTGYPMVDAGMRELWNTGWMHNRVRMIVASFLVKHLLIPWQEGARWFWDTLVDADLANNTFGWQWTAGCGADAAPYFRVFNPVLQGQKFDPVGAYVRYWIPEIARLADGHIHNPWTAPTDVLSKAGICLGKDYPRPIVEHEGARDRALLAYHTIKRVKRG